jgi:hypothetical protein
MHFVRRSPCPKLLADNKVKWTAPWLAHYRWGIFGPELSKQPNKPTTGHWRKDAIRLRLIADFNKNCGYCGMLVPKPVIDDEDKAIAGKGDVDHFLAKSVHPKFVYDWKNYVWSCKPCNGVKGEFDNPQHPLLNP